MGGGGGRGPESGAACALSHETAPSAREFGSVGGGTLTTLGVEYDLEEDLYHRATLVPGSATANSAFIMLPVAVTPNATLGNNQWRITGDVCWGDLTPTTCASA